MCLFEYLCLFALIQVFKARSKTFAVCAHASSLNVQHTETSSVALLRSFRVKVTVVQVLLLV